MQRQLLTVVALLAAMLTIGACLSTAQTTQVTVDLIDNGGFEAATEPLRWDVDHWEGDTAVAVDTEVTHEGERSLRITGGDRKATAVVSQAFPLIVRDQPVAIEGFWRSDIEDGTGARIVLRWFDDAGNRVSDEPPISGDDPFDWQRFGLTAMPPAGAAAARLFLEIWRAEGSVWYDDISVRQAVRLPMPGQTMTGRSPAVVTVAVFDANAAGGRSFGAQGIHEALDSARGIESDLITDLTLPTLLQYDVLVLPNVHRWGAGGDPDVLREHPELAWMSDPRAAVTAWVRAGGGVVLTHQSNGRSEATSPTLFPGVVDVVDKTMAVKPTQFADHPVTDGLQSFDPTFSDARVLASGVGSTVIMRNADDQPLAVAGHFGRGRVVGIGLSPGIDPQEQPTEVSAGEAQLLASAVRWAEADDIADFVYVVSPDPIVLTEPGDRIELSVTAIPTADSARDPRLHVALVDSEMAPAPQLPVQHVTPTPGQPTEVVFDVRDLEDETWYVAVRDDAAPAVAVTVQNRAAFARWADSLPKPDFEWTCMNVHGPSGLRSEEDIAEMARLAKEMNFDAVLFAAKPPSAYLYYDTEIGEKDPDFPELDHLELAVKHCHALGLQLLVQFCTFREGSASQPSKFIREHPEWANWNPGDGPDISQHQNGVFGCPDRPEVREYELSLMREIAENYDIDGFSFDYIRYKNDRWCVCPFSQQHFARWAAEHPEIPESEARARHAEEMIVSFTWEVREMLDEVKPDAMLHGYVHPTWANRFPLDYLSFRASAHWTQPGRGGPWPLERVYEAARRNVDLADDHVDFMKAAPMADTGYYGHHKPADRFRRELRLINHAGAPAVMVYPYSTLRRVPELREVIAEELAD